MSGEFGANSYRAGGALGICDECGRRFRLSDMRTRWDKALVCEADWEPRHPQEFVRGTHDRIKAPGPIRPEPADVYTFGTLRDQDDFPITVNDSNIPIIIQILMDRIC